jgi:hypothetical protein
MVSAGALTRYRFPAKAVIGRISPPISAQKGAGATEVIGEAHGGMEQSRTGAAPCARRSKTMVKIRSNRMTPILALSFCGHAGVAALLLWRADLPPPPAPPAEISVSLVEEGAGSTIEQDVSTTAQPLPQANPARAARKPSFLPSADRPRPRSRPSDVLQTAQHLFAMAALNDPKNDKAREALGTLAADERRIQLCNIEAMEQLRRTEHVAAELVAPYAFKDIAIRETEIVAEGAAVQAGRQWRKLRYRCTIGSAAEAPSDFAFSLGADIPTAEWSDHFLTAGSAIDE